MTKARKKAKSQDTKGTTQKKVKSESGNDKGQEVLINSEVGEIDKIRTILFGTQMEMYEGRFAQLEERINSQIKALGSKTDSRFEKVESLIEKHIDALTERLNSEQSERSKGGEALSREIIDAKEQLTESIETLSAQQAQDNQSLKEQLTALSNELSDEIHIQQVEASKNLKQAVDALDDDKIARKVLSQLLTEMAGRLADPKG